LANLSALLGQRVAEQSHEKLWYLLSSCSSFSAARHRTPIFGLMDI
jgi:hypothetical protein